MTVIFITTVYNRVMNKQIKAIILIGAIFATLTVSQSVFSRLALQFMNDDNSIELTILIWLASFIVMMIVAGWLYVKLQLVNHTSSQHKSDILSHIDANLNDQDQNNVSH